MEGIFWYRLPNSKYKLVPRLPKTEAVDQSYSVGVPDTAVDKEQG